VRLLWLREVGVMVVEKAGRRRDGEWYSEFEPTEEVGGVPVMVVARFERGDGMVERCLRRADGEAWWEVVDSGGIDWSKEPVCKWAVVGG